MIDLRVLERRDINPLMKIMGENDDSTRVEAKARYLRNLNGKFEVEDYDFAISLGGNFIGTIGYSRKTDEYVISWFHLSNQHQNKGFGSIVISKIEEMMAKASPKEVKVSTGYPKAVKFYQKHGYMVSEVMLNYYQDGADNVVLRKKLA